MKRLVIFILLIILLAIICITVCTQNLEGPQGFSLESFYRLTGQPFKTLDRSITKVLGIKAKDERELGIKLAPQIAAFEIAHHEQDKAYLNELINQMAAAYNPKHLIYRVYLVEGLPNAFALPGGIIVVTTGLLDTLNSEAQLIAILGHEKGHIDLGHCIDHMRIEAKKKWLPGINFLDWFYRSLFHHSYSKFQENEADRFGFETAISLNYDPAGLSQGFALLQHEGPQPKQNQIHVFYDYFTTHPSLVVRSENWEEKAKRWKTQHPTHAFYKGEKNYKRRIARNTSNFPEEWYHG